MNTHEPIHAADPPSKTAPPPPSVPKYDEFLADLPAPDGFIIASDVDTDISNLLDDTETQSNLSSDIAPDPDAFPQSSLSSDHSSSASDLFALKFARFIDDDDDTASVVSTISSQSDNPNQRGGFGPPRVADTPPLPPKRARTMSSITPPRHRPPPPPPRKKGRTNSEADVGNLPPKTPPRASRSMSSLASSLASSLSSSRRSVLSKLDSSRSTKDILSKLDAAVLSVEDALKGKVRNLMTFQDEMDRVRVEMDATVSAYEFRACWSVVSAATSYYQNKLLYLEAEIEMAKLHCKCFSDKFKQLRKVRRRLNADGKSKGKKGQPKLARDDLIFSVEAAISTASNIRLPKHIYDLRRSADVMVNALEELRQKYETEKTKLQSEMSVTERTQHLVTILVQICDEEVPREGEANFYYHSSEKHSLAESQFEQMLFDDRFDEGRLVMKWIRVISKKSPKNEATLANIASFAKRLTAKMCRSCGIMPDAEFYDEVFPQCLYLMTVRSCLPRIGDVWRDCGAEDDDEVFGRQCEWMSGLSAGELHVEEELLCGRDVFSEGIGELGRLKVILIPHDAVMCCVKAVMAVQEAVSVFGDVEVNGDVLFPMIVFCVVQSGFAAWHRLFKVLDEFLPPEVVERGKSGYCLAMCRAAVHFVMEQEEGEFRRE